MGSNQTSSDLAGSTWVSSGWAGAGATRENQATLKLKPSTHFVIQSKPRGNHVTPRARAFCFALTSRCARFTLIFSESAGKRLAAAQIQIFTRGICLRTISTWASEAFLEIQISTRRCFCCNQTTPPRACRCRRENRFNSSTVAGETETRQRARNKSHLSDRSTMGASRGGSNSDQPPTPEKINFAPSHPQILCHRSKSAKRLKLNAGPHQEVKTAPSPNTSQNFVGVAPKQAKFVFRPETQRQTHPV